jgi:ribosomal protein S18 acetylase RimI-like enzyme
LPASAEKTLRVRPASPEDAEAIAQIHVQGFEEAYRGLIPDEALDVRTVELRRRVWSERLAGGAPEAFVLVADLHGEVAGFSSGRAASAEEAAGHPGRIGCWENLYVRPDAVGSADGMRIGFALHQATVERLSELGFDEAVNFVVEGNERARRFFEAVGWRADGMHVVREGIVHHRHHRELPR